MRRLPGILALAVAALLPASASADSCWDHNGSVMRLVANGNQRAFYYEVPRPVLAGGGVRQGTLLFNGVKSGDWYSGTSRVFSKFCPGNPAEYAVEGPVDPSQTRVTLRGTRQVFSQCRGTGRQTTDVLVFTYIGQCPGDTQPPVPPAGQPQNGSSGAS